MVVKVTYTEGKTETFRHVEDVQNQAGEYRMPRKDGTCVLIPKTSARCVVIEP